MESSKGRAALHELDEHCAVLRSVGMERIFDGLRATCFIPFQFNDYAASIIGEEPAKLRQFAMRLPLQCSRLQLIEMLRTAFCEWEAHPCLCTLDLSIHTFGWNCLQRGLILAPWTHPPSSWKWSQRCFLHKCCCAQISTAGQCSSSAGPWSVSGRGDCLLPSHPTGQVADCPSRVMAKQAAQTRCGVQYWAPRWAEFVECWLLSLPTGGVLVVNACNLPVILGTLPLLGLKHRTLREWSSFSALRTLVIPLLIWLVNLLTHRVLVRSIFFMCVLRSKSISWVCDSVFFRTKIEWKRAVD